jgi:hypothetical protein
MPDMSAISRPVLPFASHDRTSVVSAFSPTRAVAVTIEHSPAESIARCALATHRFTRYSVRKQDDQREYEGRQNKNDLQDPRLQFVVHKFHAN